MKNGKKRKDINRNCEMGKEGEIIVKASHEGSFGIEIRLIKPNKFGVFLSLLIPFIFFLLPISLLFIDELEIGFGYIITIVLCWSCSVYFIRKALWSWRGKEVYNIKKDSIQYYYDYWFFKDGITEKKFKNLKFGYIKLGEDSIYLWEDSMMIESDFDCHLVLMLDDEPIISNIMVGFKDILEVMDKLF